MSRVFPRLITTLLEQGTLKNLEKPDEAKHCRAYLSSIISDKFAAVMAKKVLNAIVEEETYGSL